MTANASARAGASACANRGAPFVPERRRFCPECGQETDVAPPRLREFLQQFGGAYLSTEGALWRTLKLLLFKSGELTARYLAGQRKHHMLPLRLYPTISLLTLLTLGLAGNAAAGAWLCKRFQRRIDIDPKAMASEVDVIKERFLGNVGAAMFLLLPSFALWLKPVYLGCRLRYTEHLVFALHVHALWFLALAVVMTGRTGWCWASCSACRCTRCWP